MHRAVAAGEKLHPGPRFSACTVLHYRINAVFEPLSSTMTSLSHLRGLENENCRELAMSGSDTSLSTCSEEKSPVSRTMHGMSDALDGKDGDDIGLARCGDQRGVTLRPKLSSRERVEDVDASAVPMAAMLTSPADRWRMAGDHGAPSSASGEPMIPPRRARSITTLSPKRVDGVGWEDAHYSNLGETAMDQESRRRCRTGTEEQRIPASTSFRRADPPCACGAPSEGDQQQNLPRQCSSEVYSPPPQVLQGWKSNNVLLDKRSWLEVRDKQHRYGKNLRLYFKEWVRRGKPDGSFFSWLSSAEVQLDGCPRDELESDVVHYCHPEERVNYALRLTVTAEGRAMLHTARGAAVDCGKNAWLFVLRDRTIFATDKKTDPPRFHHSSFFGGGCVEAAGMLMAVNGFLVNLYPHSGHYRPTDRHLHRLLLFLSGLGVDLSAIQVDAQRVHKVARPDKKSEKRARKMDNPYMVSGRYLLDFFEAKLRASTSSLFQELRRKANEWNSRRASSVKDGAFMSQGEGGEKKTAALMEDAGAVVGGGRAQVCIHGGTVVSSGFECNGRRWALEEARAGAAVAVTAVWYGADVSADADDAVDLEELSGPMMLDGEICASGGGGGGVAGGGDGGSVLPFASQLPCRHGPAAMMA